MKIIAVLEQIPPSKKANVLAMCTGLGIAFRLLWLDVITASQRNAIPTPRYPHRTNVHTQNRVELGLCRYYKKVLRGSVCYRG